MRVAPQMLSMPLGLLPRLVQLVSALQRRVPHLFHLGHYLPVLRGRALFVGHLVSQMLGADPALQQLSQRIVLSQLRVGLQDRHLKQHVQDVHFALCHLQLVGMSQLRDGLLLLVKCMHSMSQRMCFLQLLSHLHFLRCRIHSQPLQRVRAVRIALPQLPVLLLLRVQRVQRVLPARCHFQAVHLLFRQRHRLLGVRQRRTLFTVQSGVLRFS